MKRAKQLAERRALHFQWRLARSKRQVTRLLSRRSVLVFPGDISCDHDWQRDGQTMTAVRWTCSKCGGSYCR